ncbi:MAG TPA: aldehyde dehydrogenase [Ruminiclostridium sp.]|nr:aldehyde dehydrogenase [Ruminiclostridium sp.]
MEKKIYKQFINGKFQDAVSGRTFASINPATGERISEIPEGDEKDIDLAVKAARKAFDDGEWRNMIPTQRGKLLAALGELVRKNAGWLSELETMDNGKAIRETSNEMNTVADSFFYFGGMADKIQGNTIPLNKDLLNYVIYEPIGVVGAIVPWNSPFLMACWKIAPALAAGNTVVLKPAEQTSSTALELAGLIKEAGFPDGVINIVTGFGETAGAALCRHPGVDCITFTGETVTGEEIMRTAGAKMKRVSMELGGKSPQIVFEDADIDQAVAGIMSGVFTASGQTCVAGSRVYVHKDIYNRFLELLVDRARKVRVGNPLNAETEMGSLASREQLEKVKRYVAYGVEDGATLMCGGSQPSNPELSGGCFFTPTVFANATQNMRIVQNEIFGPVVVVMPFSSEDEAVHLANDIRYGLAAGIWTNNIKRANRVALRIKAGTVWINTYRVVHYASPHGGYKGSGIGRENGMESIRLYTEVKNIMVELRDERPDTFKK